MPDILNATTLPALPQGSGPAQPTRKIRLARKTDGHVIEAWPVDAREHLAAGDFVLEADYVPPTKVADVESSDTDATDTESESETETTTRRRTR